MARTVTKKYHIFEGPDRHMWYTSDPPYPAPRYKVVRTVIVNDQVFEEPTEQEKKSLLPEEYDNIDEAIKVCRKLNDDWFALDPNKDRYK